MGCHKLTYSDNLSSLKVVYSKLSEDKTLYKYKYQWDYIHDPAGGLYMFQDEEEAAMELQCEDVLKARLAEIKEANSKEESSIKMNWSNDDFDCSLFDVKIGETTFEQIGFIAPFSDYGGEFNFNPTEYIKTGLEEFGEVKKDFVRYDFGDFEYEDNQMVMLSVIVLKEQADELEKYLFSNTREKKIADALENMEQYLGNPYKFGGGENRTSLDSIGTAEMDCSEFMCRFLQELGVFESVPNITTTMLSEQDDFAETQFGEKLQYITGSNKDDFIPQAGDIFEWSRGEGDGHTGVVVEYVKSSDYIIVLEAIGCTEPCSNDLTLNPDRGCCKVVKSTYKRTGNSLQGHAGWKGYYRPVIN